MKTLAAPIEEKFLQCFASLSTVEGSVCKSLNAVTDLLEAMNKKSNASLFKNEELKEAKEYIVTLLKSLSDIQYITLRKTKIHLNYLSKNKIKFKYDPKHDLECFKIIQDITNRIKSDATFASDHWQSLIPTLKRISQYYHEKGNLMGANITNKSQSSPPWISKQRKKQSKTRR